MTLCLLQNFDLTPHRRSLVAETINSKRRTRRVELLSDALTSLLATPVNENGANGVLRSTGTKLYCRSALYANALAS